jgi:hypothetical protein
MHKDNPFNIVTHINGVPIKHECEGCQTTEDTYSTGGGLYICKACDDKNALEYTVGLLQELIKDGLCDGERAERAIEIISEQNNL